MIDIERHPWEPYIPKMAKVLFLGSFPPKKSKWSMDFYYPNKINDFWRIMGISFFNNPNYFWNDSSKSFNKLSIISFLNNYKIAIGDCGLEVKRLKDNASDKYLEIITTINLRQILSSAPFCDAIVTTGQRAAEIISKLTTSDIPKIGHHTEAIINDRKIKIYRLPSTSRAYPMSITQKSQYYKSLFEDIGIL